MRCLCRYTLHLPGIAVVLLHAAAMTTAEAGEHLPPRLQARFVELSTFRCNYVVGKGALAVEGAVSHIKGSVDASKVTHNLW